MKKWGVVTPECAGKRVGGGVREAQQEGGDVQQRVPGDGPLRYNNNDTCSEGAEEYVGTTNQLTGYESESQNTLNPRGNRSRSAREEKEDEAAGVATLKTIQTEMKMK